MVPLKTDTKVLKNWAMIVAMMLNGTEHILSPRGKKKPGRR